MLHRHFFENRAIRACAATIAMSVISGAAHGGGALYVDDDAPAGGDGTSWDTAYRFLQDGLADASGGGVTEIRVAQGTYKPDRDETNPDGTGDREATFQLINGMALMGGYAGLGAKDPDARDIELYETVLSGDLLGNDGPDFQNNDENSYHVLIGPFTKGSPILDGFTVTAGHADGRFDQKGAGLYTILSIPILVDCLFIQNKALHQGGAIRTQPGCVAFRCRFVNNMSLSGGAMFTGGVASLEQCMFVANESSGSGGALYTFGQMEIIRSTFVANEASGSGGAIAALTASLLSCVFNGNSAGGNGGAIRLSSPDPGAQIINCTIAHNSSADLGGGLYLEDVNIIHTNFLTNCIVWGNADKTGDGEGAQITLDEKAVLEINYSCIQGWTGNFGGFGNIGDDPLFVDPVGRDGIPGTVDDDLHLADGSPCVNRADSYAGFEVGFLDIDGDVRTQHCRLDMGADESPLFASDCNDNGDADECDLTNLISTDCNQNGVLDVCDIADGNSDDCNENGFPDDCDVEPAIYRVDDGTEENTLGLISPGDLVWLNKFTAMQDGEVIDGIDLCWGRVEEGTLTDLAVWLDPSNDGDPTDAVLVRLVEDIPAQNTNTSELNTIAIPPTFVGDTGDVFFVGAHLVHANNEYPACVDLTPPSRRSSWFVSGGNLQQLWNNIIPPTLIDEDCCAGNWLIRARRVGSDDDDRNGIPDECDGGTVGPDGWNAFRGFYDSGDLNSLLESDDDKLCYNPGIVLLQTEAPITLDFIGTLPNDSPASLDVTIESSANTVGLELTFSFWNYNTNSWDVVGTDTQSLNADTARTFPGDPADHVEPGTGEVRTRYEIRVVSFIFLFPWLDCVDRVFWTTTN